jgi:hypothetical protein
MLFSSSAFGALTAYESVGPNPSLSYWTVDNVGQFSFDADIEVLADSAVQPPPNPNNVITQMESWGDAWDDAEPFTFSYKFDNTSGLVGSVDFPNPVQIVVAKWGSGGVDEGSWAFLLSTPTTHFDWDLSAEVTYVNRAMSHAEGYNAVPVPAAVWLLGSGVLGLVAVRRRRS